ncbi:MAG: prepilin peptidase [Syntrophorhabdaceae bacterium]|nr:prepilin peptidase [Syntrophorhabdaceae bacterium]
MHIIFLIVVFVFGAVIGSFLNVCIYRIPRKKSIVHPPSSCPACEKPVRFYDNVPLISYLVLKGKCRDCGARISFRYFLVELITAVVFMMIYRRWGLSYEFFIQMFFVAVLIVVSFIDYDFQIIPDILSVGGMVAGLIISLVRPGFQVMEAVWGVLIGGGVLFAIAYGYQLITKREGMGGGDIKLLAMIGSFSGLKGVLFSLIGGSIVGTLVGIPLMFMKGREEGTKYAIPFGPFLSLCAVLYLFMGPGVIHAVNEFLLNR